ncbi:dTDP-4-dehydrorhamnose reductase [Williamwhitmania taraxaci]|uniref:dTDP-4-dehydrorhamnose reductase n=2 Tax=Williamwhitmania taraxaci TaxID=1640674 RepID=A0A1G6JMU0_9BACT|nr:dTDP-4-dehydrorhamnose reductase [Williamwhitmania taraxaci]
MLHGKGEKDVFLCSSSENRLNHLAYPFSNVDITKREELRRLFLKVRPDIVFNTAAIASPDVCVMNKELALLVNVDGARNIAELSTLYGAHLVHFSTDFVFNGCKPYLTEEDAPDPVNYYGFTKWESEKVVNAYADSYAIVRTVSVYGFLATLTRSNFILRVKAALEAGKEYRVPNDQFRTPTLVEDLANISIKIGIEGHSGLFHIAGQEGLTNYEFAIQAASVFCLDPQLIIPVSSFEMDEKAVRPLNTGFDISKARTILGYSPTTLLDGLMLVKSQIDKHIIC